MRHALTHFLAVSAIGAFVAFSGSAFGKTIKECDAEYAANKAAIKASGQKKADFVASCRTGAESTPSGAAAAPAAPAPAPATVPAQAGVKTAKECNAEYAANKAAIKASGQKKADYVASCRAGTATAAAPAPAPVAPAPAPPPVQTAAPSPAPMAPAPLAPKPKPQAAATGAGGAASEAQAKARCPNDTVVWANTRSGIYHFAGTHNYGTTKQGAYMCEADAKAAGDRAAENEKHP